MNRRAFITLLGGAAAWPLAARAQHRLPASRLLSDALRQGLNDAGFVEGSSITGLTIAKIGYRDGPR